MHSAKEDIKKNKSFYPWETKLTTIIQHHFNALVNDCFNNRFLMLCFVSHTSFGHKIL